MKQLGLICGFFLCFHVCTGQYINLREFTDYLDMPPYKLETHLQRRGFKKNPFMENEELAQCLLKKDKSDKNACLRGFRIEREHGELELVYQTTSQEEFTGLKEEIRLAGFNYPEQAQDSQAVIYQKRNIRIESSVKAIDSNIFYVLKGEKRTLPRKKDIIWAEDLQSLDAHVYLTEIFGKENVQTEMFYFSDRDSNLCSVLYPDTNREAIFIWNDETNLKDLSFILIGGNMRARAKNPVSHNLWLSRQGIYCGMSLAELEKLNKAPVRFYNWKAESAGYPAPHNRGSIDFTRIGFVLNCLNCRFLATSDSDILDSASALGQDQKVYVTTVIILPEKKAAVTAARK